MAIRYSINPQIGKVKYSVNVYGEGYKHRDGSEQVGIRTFKTKKEFNKFLKLKRVGEM